jgi:hypothetical protein
MDKKFLLETARRLIQVSAQSADEFLEKSELLNLRINAVMMADQDLENLIGSNNLGMMKDNHTNHVRFIASILKNPKPEVFVETILWVFRTYRSHSFTPNYWIVQLKSWLIILKEELSPECYSEVLPYYIWMETNVPVFLKVSYQE